MNCPACGAVNSPGVPRCGRCGAPLAADAPVNPCAERPQQAGAYPYPPPGSYPTSTPGVDDGLRMIVPIGVSPWAIAAGYLGLVSPICVGITGPLAIIAGIIALKQIKKDPRIGGKVRSIIGIVLGALGTLMLLGFLIAMIVG